MGTQYDLANQGHTLNHHASARGLSGEEIYKKMNACALLALRHPALSRFTLELADRLPRMCSKWLARPEPMERGALDF